jgi:hypothetical protein
MRSESDPQTEIGAVRRHVPHETVVFEVLVQIAIPGLGGEMLRKLPLMRISNVPINPASRWSKTSSKPISMAASTPRAPVVPYRPEANR